MQTLFALLVFSKFKIIIFHVYSYILIIYNQNLNKIFTTVTCIHAVMTQ